MNRKRSLGQNVFTCLNYVILFLIDFTMLYPFIYFLVLSFNEGVDAMRGGIYFFPRVFTLENYMRAFEYPGIFNSFKVSVFIAIAGTLLSLLFNAIAAYALTFKKLPGRSFLIFFMYFSTMFSGGMIPSFVLLKELHLLNTIWVYIVPGLFSFYNMVIMRTFFNGIPDALSEAAYIDGSNEFGIFFRIILPLSTPVLATIALFTGVGLWNDWFTGAFYVTEAELKPAATVLQQILTESTYTTTSKAAENVAGLSQLQKSIDTVTPQALQYTFVIIITVPIIMIYPFLQKYFVKGVMVGAIKD